MSTPTPPPAPNGAVLVPEELEQVPAGAMLAALLEELPAEQVCGFDTVRLLEAAYRQLSHVRAVFLSILRETGLRRPGSGATVERAKVPSEFSCEEARAALVWSRNRAATNYALATDVFDRLPVLGEAMLAGVLDEPRAQAFIEWTRGLTDTQAEQVCDELLGEAPGLMVAELVDRIKRACLAIDPDWAEKRYRDAVKTRRVHGSRNPDGTANLGGYSQPIDRIAAACEYIDTLARACKRAGDRRKIDLIRSDLFLGMTGGTFAGLTEPQIIAYVLAHPYTDDPDTHNSDNDTGDGDPTDDSRADSDDGGDSGDDGDTDPDGDPDQSDDDHGGGPDGSGPGDGGAGSDPDGGVGTQTDSTAERHDGDPGSTASMAGTDSAAGSVPRAVPELRVELSTLLGVGEHPGEIPPWGFIPARLARGLVERMYSAEWRYVLCDPDGRAVGGGILRSRPRTTGTRVGRDARRGGIVEIAVETTGLARLAAGQPSDGPWKRVLAELARHAEQAPRGLDTNPRDSRRRTAGAPLRRWIQLRDRQCIHPCCRMPAAKTDQDHRTDFAAGGLTTEDNIEPKCRHDHRLKHEAGWSIQRPEPGVVIWTSGLGHRYESRPPPVIPRLPEPQPDPDDDRDRPEGWYTWQSRPPPCECAEACDCQRLILPPIPVRVPDPEPEPEPATTILEDETPPF